MKRSNIITIALSRLPPPRHLPPAIYSMDSSVLDREDIQVQPPHFIILVSVCTVKESQVKRATYLHCCLEAPSSCPNWRGVLLDQGGQGPKPAFLSGTSRAMPADTGTNPTPEHQAPAVGLHSGLWLSREGEEHFNDLLLLLPRYPVSGHRVCSLSRDTQTLPNTLNSL